MWILVSAAGKTVVAIIDACAVDRLQGEHDPYGTPSEGS